jgi:hypothetical protein
MYWPKNATHVRVGLTMITFGFSTYYAPGHWKSREVGLQIVQTISLDQ